MALPKVRAGAVVTGYALLLLLVSWVTYFIALVLLSVAWLKWKTPTNKAGRRYEATGLIALTSTVLLLFGVAAGAKLLRWTQNDLAVLGPELIKAGAALTIYAIVVAFTRKRWTLYFSSLGLGLPYLFGLISLSKSEARSEVTVHDLRTVLVFFLLAIATWAGRACVAGPVRRQPFS